MKRTSKRWCWESVLKRNAGGGEVERSGIIIILFVKCKLPLSLLTECEREDDENVEEDWMKRDCVCTKMKG